MKEIKKVTQLELPQITEEELQRRLALIDAKTVIAGPDHPIYAGGLRLTMIGTLLRNEKDEA